MDHSQQQHEAEPHSRRGKWVLIGFLLIAAFFLWTEHRAHVLDAVPYLPYLLLLACPLMHFFHHGHGQRSHHRNGQASENGDTKQTTRQAGEES